MTPLCVPFVTPVAKPSSFCASGSRLVWTVGYCYLFGYRHAPDSWLVRNGVVEASASGRMPTHLGLPSWVFWGIVVPAGCCSVITLLLGLFGMKDDAMGEEQEGPTS